VKVWSLASTAAIAAGLSLAVSGCTSSAQQVRTSQPKAKKIIVYNGGTVEGRLERATAPSAPRPFETEDEQRARVHQLSLEAMPCDVRVESVPHGISITFFVREGSRLEASQIQEQVALITRIHNKLFHVPEVLIEGAPESQPLVLDATRPDHSPLRALMAIPSLASWEETPGGARLTLITNDPRDVEDLRAHVRWNAPELLPEVMAERKRCPDVPEDLRARLHR
jgi:hypothetical protein